MVKKEDAYEFLMSFRLDSAFTINNLLRGHSKKQYESGKFHSFDFVTGGFGYNDWGDPAMMHMTSMYIAENSKYTYQMIEKEYIDMVHKFAEYMGSLPALKEPLTLWRGCNDLEVDGVNGVVSATTDKKIAEQFNRGTILKINVPKGAKVLFYDKITPRSANIEHEVLLPPCDYTIVSDSVERGKIGPNNRTGGTRVVEINVEPRDLIREFAKAMEHLPGDYHRFYRFDINCLRYITWILNARTLVRCISSEAFQGTARYGLTDVLKTTARGRSKPSQIKSTLELINEEIHLPKDEKESFQKFLKEADVTERQISDKEFLDFINSSKAKLVLDDYANSSNHSELYNHKDHGIRHVDNVTLFTYYIASKKGYTPEGIRILMEAARFHDIGRTNWWQEGGHGHAGLEKYNEMNQGILPISERQLVGFLIYAHDLPSMKDVESEAKGFYNYLNKDLVEVVCEMASIIRDADALDRTRFNVQSGAYLNPSYLQNQESKEIIELAQKLNIRQRALKVDEESSEKEDN